MITVRPAANVKTVCPPLPVGFLQVRHPDIPVPRDNLQLAVCSQIREVS